jgi:hypothetical protein
MSCNEKYIVQLNYSRSRKSLFAFYRQHLLDSVNFCNSTVTKPCFKSLTSRDVPIDNLFYVNSIRYWWYHDPILDNLYRFKTRHDRTNEIIKVAEKELERHFTLPGGRGGAVGWGTALQTGRSRVRFPMMSLEFFIGIILPVALWPWGRLSL